LFVGHSERFNPVVRALADRLDPCDVESIELGRSGPLRAAGGVLLHLGIHDLDLAAHLGGARARVVDARASDDAAQVALVLESGARASVRVARVSAKRSRMLRVITQRSVFHGDMLDLRLLREDRVTGGTEEIPLFGPEPLAGQADALAVSLAGGASVLATGEDGARALALVEQAYRFTRCVEEPLQGVEKL
jgi:predicted dehydrogenase